MTGEQRRVSLRRQTKEGGKGFLSFSLLQTESERKRIYIPYVRSARGERPKKKQRSETKREENTRIGENEIEKNA